MDRIAAERAQQARDAEEAAKRREKARLQREADAAAQVVHARIKVLLGILERRNAPDAVTVPVTETVRVGGRFFGYDETRQVEKAAWLLYERRWGYRNHHREFYYLLSDGRVCKYEKGGMPFFHEEYYSESEILAAVNRLIDKYR